ncbi:ogr/Delta-like zinc finger family protein [Methylophaga marina]|uniref:ogr/Delta-like zinc finger family protein n=1 Tax=Methylophaga marina TaxID=45495 RepID=UPI0033056462
MRIECPHCHRKAIISSTNALSHTVKDLYCQCTNLEGGLRCFICDETRLFSQLKPAD